MENLNINEYNNFKRYFDDSYEENIINVHKELIGKSVKDDIHNIKDCGIEFIRELLTRDWGRSIVYEYSEGAKKFMQSEYLSDYFKHELIKILKEMNYISDEKKDGVLKILNSSKSFNEMAEDEIKYIFTFLTMYMSNRINNTSVDFKVVQCLNLLKYKLNGKGIISYLKDDNYITKRSLAEHILLTSGLNDRASYYSGRGVNFSDLNDNNLYAIFEKLVNIDIYYAINFVEMVNSMKTLGATEFIKTFKSFAENNFEIDNLKKDNNNVSMDGVYYYKKRNVIGLASIIEIASKKDDDYQIRASNNLKRSFICRVNPILKELNINLENIGQYKERNSRLLKNIH